MVARDKGVYKRDAKTTAGRRTCPFWASVPRPRTSCRPGALPRCHHDHRQRLSPVPDAGHGLQIQGHWLSLSLAHGLGQSITMTKMLDKSNLEEK